jgi:very-short-patch-repair endonuclease
VVHRRRRLEKEDVTVREGVPVTSPVRTLVDIAARLRTRDLERAINEADKLGLVDTEALRATLCSQNGIHGVGRLRDLVDGRMPQTDSELERRFVRLIKRAGLERADFFWPDLRLVVETDGLRYHRTPIQQARDRERDQAYATAGLTPLRFTYAQITRDPDRVVDILRAVAARLSARN